MDTKETLQGAEARFIKTSIETRSIVTAFSGPKSENTVVIEKVVTLKPVEPPALV